jgi:ArsR family transcriptional regulator
MTNIITFYSQQAELFKALTHPVRLAILDILRDGEQCVCHMEAALGKRQAVISQHLMLLRQARLVTYRRDGWNIFYQVIRPDIYQVIDAARTFGGVPVGQPVPAPMKAKQPCPCPRCNPGKASIGLEEPILEAAKAGK